ncbi:hypothetical protein HXX76_003102 [Chlamydomonas incerta]|uniref:Uncharacterized protein n=1 Tax=Chlamydomonas incerta TaxID=51695 RepID=A0A835TM94_CHLIN|nr:hypothetical protein HXX76_003102 [Chlamydomonas incerta]|eukprot:KAG2441480.1 hypothetical protein HXX76_003102 [Chlamydomonas incerta]
MASICASLVFDCEVLLDSEQNQAQRMLDQLESVVLPALDRASRPASPLARDILGLVNGYLAGRAGPLEQSELTQLARHLSAHSANSFDVVIRSALSTNGIECFKSLRHSFLVVRGRGEYEGMEFIVEPALRAHFTIPHPSPDYEQMLARAPDVFVGGSCRLVPLVQLLCALMADSFERQGLALPPWRKEAAMLSKWLPAANRTRDVPVVVRAHSATAVELPAAHSPFTHSVASAAAAAAYSRGAAAVVAAAQPIHVSALPASACNAIFGFGIGTAAGAAAGLGGNVESGSCCGGIDSGYGIVSDASALLLGFGLSGDALLDSGGGGYSCGAGSGTGCCKDNGGVFSLGCSPDGELPLRPPPLAAASAAGGSSSRRSLRPLVHLGFEPCAPAPAAAAAALSVWGGSPSAPGAAAGSCGSCSGSSCSGRGTGLLSAKLQRGAAAAGTTSNQQPQQAQQQQRVIETRPPAYQGEMCIRVVKLVGFNVPPAAAAPSTSIAATVQAPAQRA